MNRKVEAVQYYLRPVLWPASLLWLAAVKLRARAYQKGLLRQRRLDGVVISVGNLTVGGTGKTPLALWLVGRLAREGKAAGVLTRGYAGFARGGHREKSGMVMRADDTNKSEAVRLPDERMPDEVRLLMRRLRGRRAEAGNLEQQAAWFGIGADRHSMGKQLEQQGVGWFVLDDGFQHLPLRRDADIVLIDAENPFGNGYLLPAGRLREPVSALGRADVVVITRSEGTPSIEDVIRRHTAAHVFYGRTKLDVIRRWTADGFAKDAAFSAAEYSSQRFFAFCGIGNAQAFFADARRWGLAVCGEMAFRDHHHYWAPDWARLEKQARSAGATALLCTEKDVCNFGGDFIRGNKHGGDTQSGRAAVRVDLPVYYAQISMDLPRGDEFWRVVMGTAERNHRASGSGAR
jgi:tetraacyldisaccharide 4'-kinase